MTDHRQQVSTGRERIKPERGEREEGREEDRAGESAAPAAGQQRISAHQEHRRGQDSGGS